MIDATTMRTFIIPEEIQIAGSIYTIEQPEYIDSDALGQIRFHEGIIEIAKSFNDKGKRPKMIDCSREQTFYHEITHAILHTMGRRGLCNDEGFVDAFAHLLTQAMRQVVDCQFTGFTTEPPCEKERADDPRK